MGCRCEVEVGRQREEVTPIRNNPGYDRDLGAGQGRQGRITGRGKSGMASHVQLSSLAVLDLLPGPCRAQGYSVWGSLPPSACLPQPHTCNQPPPDRMDLRSSPLPVLSGGVEFFFPRPLCICIALSYLFHSVSWSLLKY